MPSIAYLLYLFLVSFFYSFKTISRPIAPKVSWTNIGMDPPTIRLFFQSDISFTEQLTPMILRLSLPFLVTKLVAKWSTQTICGDSSTVSVYALAETERYAFDETYSYFYLTLTGSVFDSEATYELFLSPDSYMDYTGFSEPIQLALISSASEDSIVFAHNSVFSVLLATSAPNSRLLAVDYTVDSACLAAATHCESRVLLTVQQEGVYRLVVQLTGDFEFAADAGRNCAVRSNAALGAAAVSKDVYACGPALDLGDSTRFLQFSKSDGWAPGKYFLVYPLRTPTGGGSQSLAAMTLGFSSGGMQSRVELQAAFETKSLEWAAGYPALEFSFGFSAADETVPQGVGMFSMSGGAAQVYNSLYFTFKATRVPPAASGSGFRLAVYLGTASAVVPLGEVSSDLEATPGYQVTWAIEGDALVFSNVALYAGRVFGVGLRVGFPAAGPLNDSSETGFGVVALLVGTTRIVAGRAGLRRGFVNVRENRGLLPAEAAGSIARGGHRGFSAFRSASAADTGTNAALFYPQPQAHGLRLGSGQQFFFASTLGPNFLAGADAGVPGESSRVFVEVLTHASIASRTDDFSDDVASVNCEVWASKWGKWGPQLGTAEAELALDPSGIEVITSGPSSYDPIGGCAYDSIQHSSSIEYSRFRMRLQDFDVLDGGSQPRRVSGATLLFPNSVDLASPAAANGNIFVFRNVDVGQMPSEFVRGRSESVVLDAFVRVFFAGNADDTRAALEAPPSLVFMENLYIFTPVAQLFFTPSELNFSLHNYRWASPTVTTLEGNEGDSVPAVLEIHGKLARVPREAQALKIQLDFLEPLLSVDQSLSVRCASGLPGFRDCSKRGGVVAPQSISAVMLTQLTGSVQSFNSRLSPSVIVELDPAGSRPVLMISLAVPVRLTASPALLALYQRVGPVGAFPSLTLLDASGGQLQRGDFGAGLGDFSLDIVSPGLQQASHPLTSAATFTALESGAAAPAGGAAMKKLDATAGTSAKVGTAFDATLRVACPSCVARASNPIQFHSATFCADFSFDTDGNFDAGSAGCGVIGYLGLAGSRTCVFCTSLLNPAADLSIASFLAPSSNGLQWPPNTKAALSLQKVLGLADHSLSVTLFEPSGITLSSEEAPLTSNADSVPFVAAVTLASGLQSGNAIHFTASGGEFLFEVKGDAGEIRCYILQSSVSTRCSFELAGTRLTITVLKEVVAGVAAIVSIFGLSVGSPSGPGFVELRVITDLDGLLTPAARLGDSGSTSLRFAYIPAGTAGLAATDPKLLPAIKDTMTRLSIKLTLTQWAIHENELLVLGLGGLESVEATPACIVTSADDEDLFVPSVSTCTLNADGALALGFAVGFFLREFRVVLDGLRTPASAATAMTAALQFNGEQPLFDATPAALPSLVDPPRFEVIAELLAAARGLRQTLRVYMTPYLTIQPRDIVFLKFGSTNPPSLGPGPLFAYENNFGFQELRFWLEEPGLLGVTGFRVALDAGRPCEFFVQGLDLISAEGLVMFICGEEGLSDPLQVAEPPTPSTMLGPGKVEPLWLDSATFDPQKLRSVAEISLQLRTLLPTSMGLKLRIDLDFLGAEVLRLTQPRLWLEGEELTLVRTGIRLLAEMPRAVPATFTLRLTGIPTPDTAPCEMRPPAVAILGASGRLLAHTAIVASRSGGFAAAEDALLLEFDYTGLKEAFVTRGFVDSVRLRPAGTGGSYFRAAVSVFLTDSQNGLFEAGLGESLVGSDSFTISLGAAREAALSGYLLSFAAATAGTESEPYLDPSPLAARVRLVRGSLGLNYPLRVFKGGSSLPLLVKPNRPPFAAEAFEALLIDPPDSEVSIEDGSETFELAAGQTRYLFYLQATSAAAGTRRLKVVSKLSNSLFDAAEVQIEVADPPSQPPAVLLTVREVEDFSTAFDFTATGEVYVVGHLAPEYDFVPLASQLIEALLAKGVESEGRVLYFAGVLSDYRVPLSFRVGDLRAGTKYIISATVFSPAVQTSSIERDQLSEIKDTFGGEDLVREFNTTSNIRSASFAQASIGVDSWRVISSPLSHIQSLQGVQSSLNTSFTTTGDPPRDSRFTLSFSSPLYLDSRCQILCKIASTFSVSYENLYSSEGSNCLRSLFSPHRRVYYNGLELSFNSTLAQRKAALSSETSDQNALMLAQLMLEFPFIAQLEIRIYSPRKEGQADPRLDLFDSTRRIDRVKFFNDLLGFNGGIIGVSPLVPLRLGEIPSVQVAVSRETNRVKIAISAPVGNSIAANTDRQDSKLGSIVIDRSSLATGGIRDNGAVLAILARKEIYESGITLRQFFDVEQHHSFRFIPLAKSSSAAVVASFDDIEEETLNQLMVFFAPMNDDDRPSLKVGEIKSVLIDLQSTTVPTSQPLNPSALLLLLLLALYS